jgi:hypothetical protein
MVISCPLANLPKNLKNDTLPVEQEQPRNVSARDGHGHSLRVQRKVMALRVQRKVMQSRFSLTRVKAKSPRWTRRRNKLKKSISTRPRSSWRHWPSRAREAPSGAVLLARLEFNLKKQHWQQGLCRNSGPRTGRREV